MKLIKKLISFTLSALVAVTLIFGTTGCSKEAGFEDLQSYYSMNVGETLTLGQAVPDNIKLSDITWTSNNYDIKVDKAGNVTARTTGSAIITITYKGRSYSCTVQVFNGTGTHNNVTHPGSSGTGGLTDAEIRQMLRDRGVPETNINNMFDYYNSDRAKLIEVSNKLGGIAGNYSTLTGNKLAGGISKVAVFADVCNSTVNFIDVLKTDNASTQAQMDATIDMLASICNTNPFTSTYGSIISQLKDGLDYVIEGANKYNANILYQDLPSSGHDYTLDELQDPAKLEDLYNFCIEENGEKLGPYVFDAYIAYLINEEL